MKSDHIKDVAIARLTFKENVEKLIDEEIRQWPKLDKPFVEKVLRQQLEVQSHV
jgi:hypothetical protein